MNKKEYNRHIRYFIKEFSTFYHSDIPTNKEFFEKNEQFEKEFKRLYDLDNKGEYITPSLVIKMVCINRILRVIPFYLFYINHEI